MYQTAHQPPRKPRNWKLIGGITGAAITLALIGSCAGNKGTPGSSANAPATNTASSGKPTATSTSAALPNLVGKGLQSAQDAAQDAGFYSLKSHDSLGRARHQVWDRDWKVCSQTPTPGQHDTGTTVDLGAVKLEETCPAKDATAPAKATSTMPDFTGKSLAAVRDALDSSTSITTEDASADGRIIVLESNWKVCSQTPAAGAKLTGQPVTFKAVKFGESCP